MELQPGFGRRLDHPLYITCPLATVVPYLRAFYRCWSARPVPLHGLVRVAGTRWNVETRFQTGKSIGLDQPQVRRWDSWYHGIPPWSCSPTRSSPSSPPTNDNTS